MRTVTVMMVVVICVAFLGCQRSNFKATIVAEGQLSPHAGYNLGPDIWVEQGDPVKISGAVVWIEGLDPNSLTQ